MKILTKTVKAYKFSELSDEAKEKALNKFFDVNVAYEWWDSVYDDANNVSLKLTGFDIDRGSYCKGNFLIDAETTAKKIIEEHGKTCETYKTARSYMKERKAIKNGNTDGIDADFLKSILEDYRIMLSSEWDYKTSKEAITETIEANDYDFTEDGAFPAI